MHHNNTPLTEYDIETSTINFNKKLMEMLCNDDDDEDDHDNCCLISGERLEDNCITLKCNHSFNYQHIFAEINQQKKINCLETTKLKNKEIKCPYCREVQQGILPWRVGYSQIKNVNWPLKYAFKHNKCSHIMKSGKRKGQPCNALCCYSMCTRHIKATENEKLKSQTFKCMCILKSGKRKGEICNSNIKSTDLEGIKYKSCRRHIKFAIKNHTLTSNDTATNTINNTINYNKNSVNKVISVSNVICSPCIVTI